MNHKKIDFFFLLLFFFSIPIIVLLTLPLGKLITSTPVGDLLDTINDSQVISAISRSISTSLIAAFISFIFGTPLAYLLARKDFRGKQFIEGLIDLPIMIPHPVIGIAILGLATKDSLIGKVLMELGIQIMGTYTGIICVLTFVGLPFYVNAAKAGFEEVPVRLEYVSRSLGASPWQTFLYITVPIAWRHIILGMIMCTARAISEFGAIVIVAYHPMTAPVLIYERFTAYGLRYSSPVAVLLIIVSLTLFIFMRFLTQIKRK